MDDPAATELLALATAARGLLQRTRVIRKRLNSLCALHPRMMGELLEGGRPGSVESAESLNFPDPYELGTLEVRPPLLVILCNPHNPSRVVVCLFVDLGSKSIARKFFVIFFVAGLTCFYFNQRCFTVSATL